MKQPQRCPLPRQCRPPHAKSLMSSDATCLMCCTWDFAASCQLAALPKCYSSKTGESAAQGVVELHPAAGPLAARRPPQDLGGPHHRLGVLPLRQHQGEALWPGDPHQVHRHAPGGPRPRQEPGDLPHRRAAAPSTRHRQGEASLQRGGPHRVHPAAHPLPHHPAVVPPVPHPVRCGLWLVLLPWNYYGDIASLQRDQLSWQGWRHIVSQGIVQCKGHYLRLKTS